MNIYEYAENTERSGIRFYREMADRACDKGVRNIFKMLAHDEESLLEKLRRMRSRFPGIGKKNSRYLRKGDNVFEKMRAIEPDLAVDNDIAAYQLARSIENKVLRKYKKAAEAEASPETRNYLEWIAALENTELREIEKTCDFVDAPNHFLEWGEFSNLEEFHNFGRYEDR